MPSYTGDGNNNTIIGSQTDDQIWGLGGGDILKGGGGHDTLNGGTGNDVMDGGAGNDVYIVDSADDKVIESANNGNDTVRTSVTFGLAVTAEHIENMVLTGTADISGGGNGLDNAIYGNSGNNALFGVGGNDVLKGGGGDDTLYGGTGEDTLFGGSGADVMIGGDHDDTYYVDNWNDQVTEYANHGVDTVFSEIHHTLSANVENLNLTGTADLIGHGNGADNVLVGNTGSNKLKGYGGADTIHGDGGNDMLYGMEGSDTLYGESGDDMLDGGSGDDHMIGGLGNDDYYIDSSADVVTELSGEGSDVVYSTAVSYALSDHIEILSLDTATDTGIFGTGNAQANTIFGNAGDNVLNGAGGADALSGLGGNDTFVFQAGQAHGDTVYEFAGNGAGAGDVLQFTGYGTIAEGATFHQITATTWQINSADGLVHDTITLVGAPTIDASDFMFV